MSNALKRLEPDDSRVRAMCIDVSLSELRLQKTQKDIDLLLDFVFARNNKGESHNRKNPTIIGLSANQVGLQQRICIVDFAIRRKEQSDIHVLINPHITWKSKTVLLRREGCVNFPDVWGFVPRSIVVDVTFLDRWGNSYSMRAHGWVATLLQHEIDHLNGILFIDRLKDPTKALHVVKEDYEAYKKAPKTWKKFTDVSKLAKSL